MVCSRAITDRFSGGLRENQGIFWHCVIVRYSEIALKRGWVRKRFETTLIDNMSKAIKKHNLTFSIKKERGRIFIFSEEADKICHIIKDIFGVVSCSPAICCESEIDKIVDTGKLFFKKIVGTKSEQSFAVRARRAGTHDFTSIDVARILGEKLLATNKNLKVDLKNPDIEIYVEIRQKTTFFYNQIVKGIGGLPLTTQGKTVCLISGGIDSPVASFMMMKRGCLPIFVYFDLYPFGDEENRDKVISICKKLIYYAPGYKIKLYIVPHGKNLEIFAQSSPHRLQCLLCRRMMYRIANKIAEKEHALSIVTGESLGQVASQTSENLLVEDRASFLPVFRPLIGFDKIEIEKIAREIGTFDDSVKPAQCCSIAPHLPEKRAEIDEIEDEEHFIDIDSLVKKSINEAEKVYIGN